MDRGNSTCVFVIYGRNEHARQSLFGFLRAIGLQPLEWSQAIQHTSHPTPYLGEVLDAAFREAKAVVALFTPDDLASLDPSLVRPEDPNYERTPTGQARPNVIFETGMALGRHPERTILVELGSLRPFSDVAGRHILRLTNEASKRSELAHRLKNCGCSVDLSGVDWLNVGDFSLTASKTRGTDGSDQPRLDLLRDRPRARSLE